MSNPAFPHRQFVIVSHTYSTGPAHHLVDWLRPRSREVVFIGHPFPYAPDTRSVLKVFRGGELVHEQTFVRWRGPAFSFYIKDALLTLLWALPRARSAVFVGVNNFNTLIGYMLKRLGRVERLVFYTIDYIPRRFAHPLANRLYHWLDRMAVRVADRVWNLAAVMADERERRGVARRFRRKQIVVPIGTVIPGSSATAAPATAPTIVFMGHLRRGQGVERLLGAMQEVVREVPAARMLIVGGGPLEPALKAMADGLGLAAHVTFTGYIERLEDVLGLLQGGSVAVAPYADDPATFTRYTDPGKPKDYLACGLPVVITPVPAVAWEIEARRCGLRVKDTTPAVAQAIIRLLRDDNLRQEFRANARRMAADYTWERIFSRALEQTLSI